MAVIRVNKTADYTVMSNRHFKEKAMSLKAKGLLSFMLSLPDDWDYSVAGLVAICKENESAIKSTLDELKYFGYLTVTKKMPNETATGRIEYEYNIFESPQKQAGEKQGVENQGLVFQGVENRGQINNTNRQNTDNVSKKERIKKDIQSYDEVLNDFGVCGRYKDAIFRFIQHLQLNGVKVINERLENLIIALDKAYGTNDAAKVGEIDHAITCGFKVVASELSR